MEETKRPANASDSSVRWLKIIIISSPYSTHKEIPQTSLAFGSRQLLRREVLGDNKIIWVL